MEPIVYHGEMATQRVESPEQRMRRVLAQVDKAWKLIHALRGMHPAFDDTFLIEVAQLMDDTEWEQLRLSTVGPVKPHKGKDTSCTVSREVKALVYRKLREGEAHYPKVAAPGADALPLGRRTGLRLVPNQTAAATG